jgi:antitoxin (DNA-binding transcriptional repressor) of toxin-antitoxin stability system
MSTKRKPSSPGSWPGVEAGEEVVIARDGKPIARLAPLRQPPSQRRFGALRGQMAVDDSFFAPLPEEELAGFE